MPFIQDALKEFDELTLTLNADFIQPGYSANDEIKQWLSSKLSALLEEVEKSNITYLKQLCWSDKDIEYFLRQYNKFKN